MSNRRPTPYARLCLLSARAESRSPWGRNPKSKVLRALPANESRGLRPGSCGDYPRSSKSFCFSSSPAGKPAGAPKRFACAGEMNSPLRQGFAAQNACTAHPRRPVCDGSRARCPVSPVIPRASALIRLQCGPAPARPPCASGRRPSGSA